MRISTTDFIEGGHVVYPIGKISAASGWHASLSEGVGEGGLADWREHALSELIRRAEDVDADAIIDVNYETDGVVSIEESGVSLRRVLAVGTAVKLSVAA